MLKYYLDLSFPGMEKYADYFCEIIKTAGYNAEVVDHFGKCILIDTPTPNDDLYKILREIEKLYAVLEIYQKEK